MESIQSLKFYPVSFFCLPIWLKVLPVLCSKLSLMHRFFFYSTQLCELKIMDFMAFWNVPKIYVLASKLQLSSLLLFLILPFSLICMWHLNIFTMSFHHEPICSLGLSATLLVSAGMYRTDNACVEYIWVVVLIACNTTPTSCSLSAVTRSGFSSALWRGQTSIGRTENSCVKVWMSCYQIITVQRLGLRRRGGLKTGWTAWLRQYWSRVWHPLEASH